MLDLDIQNKFNKNQIKSVYFADHKLIKTDSGLQNTRSSRDFFLSLYLLSISNIDQSFKLIVQLNLKLMHILCFGL